MKKKLNNQGITLIELMLSMALIVIITGCLMMLMNSSGKAYSLDMVQVNLQEEAQDVMNYMSDSVLSANNAISFASGSAVTGVCLYNYDDATNDIESKAFLYSADEEKLYFYYFDSKDRDPSEVSIAPNEWTRLKLNAAKANLDDEHLLCNNVKEFTVDCDQDNLPVIKYELVLESGSKPTQTYKLSNSVVIRNMLVKPSEVPEANIE